MVVNEVLLQTDEILLQRMFTVFHYISVCTSQHYDTIYAC